MSRPPLPWTYSGSSEKLWEKNEKSEQFFPFFLVFRGSIILTCRIIFSERKKFTIFSPRLSCSVTASRLICTIAINNRDCFLHTYFQMPLLRNQCTDIYTYIYLVYIYICKYHMCATYSYRQTAVLRIIYVRVDNKIPFLWKKKKKLSSHLLEKRLCRLLFSRVRLIWGKKNKKKVRFFLIFKDSDNFVGVKNLIYIVFYWNKVNNCIF